MATISRRRGKWRAQVRRGAHALSKTFLLRVDAEKWARECERSIDMDVDPVARLFTTKDSFASLIDTHIDDLLAYGKPLRRSKDVVLRRLKSELSWEPIHAFTRKRLIGYGQGRANAGAVPATLAIDFSSIGTVLTHAAAMDGLQVNLETVRSARAALTRIGAIGAPKEHDRRPSGEEFDTRFARFDNNKRNTIPMARIVEFAISPGIRLDGIVRIEWTDVEPSTRTVLVSNRKNSRKKRGNNQRVPLLNATGYDAIALISEQQAAARPKAWCFPYNG